MRESQGESSGIRHFNFYETIAPAFDFVSLMLFCMLFLCFRYFIVFVRFRVFVHLYSVKFSMHNFALFRFVIRVSFTVSLAIRL